MNKQNFKKIFWKQYLLLEEDFLETDEFVTIDKANNDTFSNRYTYLFLNICSEMDSVAEEYCKFIEKSDKCKQKTIVYKIKEILDTDTKLKNMTVKTKYPYSEIYFVPFQSFDEESSAGWWQDYNKVKHFRADIPEKGVPNYQLANLKNVMNALSALYLLCQSFYALLDGEDAVLVGTKLYCDLSE